MIQVTVTKAQLGLVAKRLEKAVQRVLEKAADYAEEEMRRRAPVRTGKLRRSIRKKVNLQALTAEVGPTVEYAVYVEYGTRPHIIRPVRAQALRFEVAGRVVFAKLVRHPGTKPRPFVRETAEAVRRQISRFWREAW